MKRWPSRPFSSFMFSQGTLLTLATQSLGCGAQQPLPFPPPLRRWLSPPHVTARPVFSYDSVACPHCVEHLLKPEAEGDSCAVRGGAAGAATSHLETPWGLCWPGRRQDRAGCRVWRESQTGQDFSGDMAMEYLVLVTPAGLFTSPEALEPLPEQWPREHTRSPHQGRRRCPTCSRSGVALLGSQCGSQGSGRTAWTLGCGTSHLDGQRVQQEAGLKGSNETEKIASDN